ncbi:MAG: precorrin-6y C5,15-methyltransferase (decarboxylating) subunit CbiE [Planctomycetota bacterium]|nr:MAG: precorrin-6y C5,15-methyltransferase (decarboxylating) subunit CbiE [Planctomycetota bacterium]
MLRGDVAMADHPNFRIDIVGCGPAGEEFLTFAAKQAIDSAELIAGTPRLVEAYARPDQERLSLEGDYRQALETLERKAAKRRTVVLVTGDPGIRSLARLVIDRFGLSRCRVIPGISSVQLAFARFGLDWTDARIVSAHASLSDLECERPERYSCIAVLAGRNDAWPSIASFAERAGERRIFVCEELGTTDERIGDVSVDALRSGRFSARSIVLLVDSVVFEARGNRPAGSARRCERKGTNE